MCSFDAFLLRIEFFVVCFMCLQGVCARSVCKVCLQGVCARCVCKVCLKGVFERCVWVSFYFFS